MTELTRNHSYIVTRDDLFVDWFTVRDGMTYATGENKIGARGTWALDVPLCHSCDAPIPSSGKCDGCDLLHLDVKAIGDGRFEVAA